MIKKRWMELRKNAQTFQQIKGWEKPEEKENRHQSSIDFLTVSNIILMLSNSFLLLANIFMLFFNLPFEIAKSSIIDDYVTMFLGIGCCLSWINCVTILAQLNRFKVVIYVHLDISNHSSKFERCC